MMCWKGQKLSQGILLAVSLLMGCAIETFGFHSECFIEMDDLTVSNFKIGRKVASSFGDADGLQDLEYVPGIGSNPAGRFFTVKNGSAIICSRIVNNKLQYESTFYFQDDRSGVIPGSRDDVYPKTSFIHTSGCAYQQINGVPYLFIHESWGDSTPKYKAQILYKCRVDAANKLLRIEGAMVVADSASGWPVAANGQAYEGVQEISGGCIVGEWIYSCEWSYDSTATPACHVFIANINDCTNPGTLRPVHKNYVTTAANQLPFMKNQGITHVGGRWFLTRNPWGKGVYEIAIHEDAEGNISGIDLLGEIRGELSLEEEGCTAYEGDLIYFYNFGLLFPAYRVELTAEVRVELLEIPLSHFSGCQSDYRDLRVFQNGEEVPRIIADGKVKFLAYNQSQEETNPYPAYIIRYGDPELGAPQYDSACINAIQAAAVSGNMEYVLHLPGKTYTDNFANASTLVNYDILDIGDTSGPSKWEISGGSLIDTSNIYGPTTLGTQFPYERGSHILLKGLYKGDWDLAVKCKTTDNDGFGLVFGQQDARNFYWVEWDQQTSRLGFCKSVHQADTGTVIAQITDYAYASNVWYTLKIQKRGANYKIYVDDELKIDADDATFSIGRVGMLNRGQSEVRYDDFSIHPVDGDYALNGAFFDDFESTYTMINYTIYDPGDHDGPSKWHITGGYLNEPSNIYGPTTYGTQYPYERGTHLIYNGRFTQDWDMSVKVKARDNDGIGLVFGYQDESNFYWLEWDRQTAKMAFCRAMNQTNTGAVMAEVTGYPYAENVWYRLKLEKRGGNYRIYVNEVLMLNASDYAFTSGRLGLLSRGSADLQYDDFRITPRQ